MASSEQTSNQGAAIPSGYRFLRGLIRAWFVLFFRKIRLLRADAIPSDGPTLFVVGHPASFLDALIVVASFKRQVHCLMDPMVIQGPLQGVLAKGLGMILYGPGRGNWPAALEECCSIVAKREAVALFAGHLQAGAGEQATSAMTAATLALEAERRHSGQLGLGLYPVHLFLPIAQSSELVIHVDPPLYPRDFLSGSGGVSDRARALAGGLEKALRQNVFALRQEDFARFLSDIEEVLRADLEEDWASRSDWKQKAKGFELSQFVVECAQELNYFNPGRLVAVRESLETYRETRRLWSLRQLQVEQAGPWLKSPWHRAWVLLESIVGLPFACYGLVNHLPCWLLLFWTGLIHQGKIRDRKVEWLARALLVLSCYGMQILLCAYWLGRQAAGFYAPSLPLSGLVLWRYGWLFQHRMRLALLALRVTGKTASLRRFRKKLIEELNKIILGQAERLGVAH